jgi:hypothetical protein
MKRFAEHVAMIQRSSTIWAGVNRIVGAAGFLFLPVVVLQSHWQCRDCYHSFVLKHVPIFSSFLQSGTISQSHLGIYEIVCLSVVLFRIAYIGIFHNYIIDAHIRRMQKRGLDPGAVFLNTIGLYVAFLGLLSFVSLVPFGDGVDHIQNIKNAFAGLFIVFGISYLTPEIFAYAILYYLGKIEQRSVMLRLENAGGDRATNSEKNSTRAGSPGPRV